jgi:hypothetical protein
MSIVYPDVPLNEDNEYFQSVLDAAFKDWQTNEIIKSYDNMLKNARYKFGELAEFLVLIGKFNYQVCNGGHSQYWSNGFASSDNNGWGEHEDCELHNRLIEYSKKYLPKILKPELCEEMIRILETPNWFDTDNEEYSYETYEEYDEENDEYYEVEEEVYNDNYGSFNWDIETLDRDYYKINDKVMDCIESFLRGLKNVA